MESFFIALTRLIRKPARNIMIMIGVAVGVFSICTINGISLGGREVISTQLDTMGLYGMSIKLNGNGAVGISDSTVVEIRQNIEGIAAITLISAEYKNATASGQTIGCVVWGIDKNADEAMSLNIICGTMFSSEDCNEGSSVCMVTEDFANKYFLSPESAIGRTVTIAYPSENADFTVKGVIKAGSDGFSTMLSEYIPAFIYVPNAAHALFDGKNTADRIAIKAAEGYDETRVAEKICRYMNVVYGGQGTYSVEDMNAKKDSFDSILSTVTDILSAIGAISLFVSGISIMTVMMITVKERTREIGIKKSLGAQDSHILAEFLAEAGIVSGTGSIVGVLAAVTVLNIAGAVLSMKITLPLSDCLGICALSVTIGIVFSLIPAFSAARLEPVNAFKIEG